MRGSSNPDDFTVYASNGKPGDPREVIFPIFRTSTDGLLHFLGTGFFSLG